MNLTENISWLETIDGLVWLCDGNRTINTSLPPPKFVRAVLKERPARLYVQADRANFHLLSELCRHLSDQLTVYLCRPDVGNPSPTRLKNFYLDNFNYRKFKLFPEDQHNFEFLHVLHAGDVSYPFRYRDHPAFSVRQFLPFGCDDSLQWVISKIVDPRLFYNDKRPTRWTRLYRFLHLTPERFNRDLPIVSAWYSVDDVEQASDPVYYFYHRLNLLPQRADQSSDARLLRMTKKFACFLAMVWVSNLLSQRTNQDMFDPQMFFRGYEASVGRYKRIR